MPTGYEGWTKLGEMLGGSIGTPGTYEKALGQQYDSQRSGYQRDKAMQEARIARAQAISREGLPAAIASDPELSKRLALAQSVLGMAEGQPNLSTYTGGLGDLDDLAITEMIKQRLAAGDVQGANQLTSVKTDKLYEPIREVGGNLLPSGVALGDDDFTMVPLPQTLALVDQREAAGNAAMIRANRPPAPRKTSAASAEAEALEQARERIYGGADPKTVADYLIRKGYPNVAAKIHKTAKPSAAPAPSY